MTRTVHGHRVDVTPCDGLRDHWRVKADGRFVGLISSDSAGYHILVPRTPCTFHQPSAALAIEALLDETVDKES